ncbi:phage BR0599 family protein [Alterisphingorhabdus coralli]|uniref:Phage BR0599 family protein n=1 Tax=Alterisphingorhabdus coralli TaxID=3071408 RepID=A0AA97I325_9SPHN|nr:phage BR0599 family protein [Parasphingorhabdus sp. SCSIO 66989]WOE76325.1 phage BR0599 family protein [Parasphingorhabdus sp. SCSIO 66989]
MSFDSQEISNASGRPIFFYEFYWGQSRWFYNSSDRNLQLDGISDEYVAAPITNDTFTFGGQEQEDFKIDMQADLPVPALFRGTPPSEPVRVVVLRKHADDLETTVFFAGRVNNVKRDDEGKATLFCSAGRSGRGGLRLTWSRTCPHMLYDSQCKVDREAFAVQTTITALSGNSFTIAAEANADITYFNGGIIAWDADGNGTLEQRTIERGISTTEFLIFGRSDGLSVGQAITLYPGCNRRPETCNDKFNNMANYGGIAQMPGESPYGVNLF